MIGLRYFLPVHRIVVPCRTRRPGCSKGRTRARREIYAADKSTVKIYTRTGDQGESSLFNGERVPKTHPILNALGDVDELNSSIGVVREYILQEHSDSPLLLELRTIQSRLMDVGSAIATPQTRSSAVKIQRTAFDRNAVMKLETWINTMDEELPPLTQFILPSGGPAAAQLHLSRSVCRRAERSILTLVSDEDLKPEVSIFLNRLSDYLFVAARYMALKSGREEERYTKSVQT